MPSYAWGDRIMVDLNWQGPKLFSLNRQPETVPSYNGVFLASSRKTLYEYPNGRSSIAYIGHGPVSESFARQVNGNVALVHLLHREGTMWLWYASVGYELHELVALNLFSEFRNRHGGNPILNPHSPTPDPRLRQLRVRHEHLSFPYDFSRVDFP